MDFHSWEVRLTSAIAIAINKFEKENPLDNPDELICKVLESMLHEHENAFEEAEQATRKEMEKQGVKFSLHK